MMKRRKRKQISEQSQSESPRWAWARVVSWGLVLGIGCLMAVYLAFVHDRGPNGNAEAATSRLRLEDIPFNGARAYEYLKQLCAIGPRPSGSRGMEAQQRLLIEHFTQLGAAVELQRFGVRHPVDGSTVPMGNLIARWHPERKERILLCAHYDTLPFPMLDPVNPRGTFVGANDGASGVALLMELGHEIAEINTPYGVDFVLFDGEEFIFSDRDRYFLGSEYFARQLVAEPAAFRYRWGVLLDMVGDADLQLYQDRTSLGWRDVRPLVEEIWATAARLGVREFIPRPKYTIQDDHVPLHNIAGIRICDIIDFDYPPWHTQRDTPEQCSALSLAKVGWVVREWLAAVR